MPKLKLKYDNLESIKKDDVNTVVFNLYQIKQSKFFWGGHSVYTSAFVAMVTTFSLATKLA